MFGFGLLGSILQMVVYCFTYLDFATSSSDVKMDLVFVLDASTSVTERNYELVKEFVKDFLLGADIDGGNVHVGVVIFSDADYVQFHLNDYLNKADVYNAIDEMPYRFGSTNTADALRTMRSVMFTKENGDRSDAANIAVVVTDGLSNIKSRRTIPEAEQCRAEGIQIYAIGVGLTDTFELDGIANKPLNKYRFVIEDFPELRYLRHKLWMSFSIGCVKAKLDLVFVLDVSTSNVPLRTFLQMIDFLKSFLHDADIDGGSIRVGVVTNRGDSPVHFLLNSHATKVEVFSALDNTPYCYACIGIMRSLRTVRSTLFTQDNGDRPRVKNVVVVITHSVSDLHHKSSIEEAEHTKAEGIRIYAIGVGLNDTKVLDGIASEPVHKNRISVKSLSELADLWQKIFVPKCFADTALDLVFVLDSSASISPGDFGLMKDFVKDILTDADIDGGKVRVGVVIYGGSAELQFHMNNYTSKVDVYDSIDKIQHIRAKMTKTGNALNFMRSVMFTHNHGDRPKVQNVAFVLTGGFSHEMDKTIYEAEHARVNGIEIYAIGIGLKNTTELDLIASKPLEEKRFLAQNFATLIDLRQKILQTLLYDNNDETNEDLNAVEEFDMLADKCNLTENKQIVNTECVFSEISNLVSKINMAKEEQFTRTLTKASHVIKKLVNTTLINPEDVANQIVETVETMWIRILEKDFCVENSTTLTTMISTKTSSQQKTWHDVQLGTSAAISTVVSLLETLVFHILKANRRSKYISIVKDTIGVDIGTAPKDIQYPNLKPNNQTNSSLQNHWINRNEIFVPQQAFVENLSRVKYSIVVIRNTNRFWKVKSVTNNSTELTNQEIVSDVLALFLSVNLTTSTGSPVRITFGVSKLETSHKDPVCVFIKESTWLNVIWSSEGCEVASITDDQIICTCDHLTTFAVVASPLKFSHYKVLTSWIIAGCIVSIICRAVTVFIYIFLWRYIRSDRSVLLVNKSVCMLITYLIFVVGIDETKDPKSCKVVAICLHYCFLTVFCNFLSHSLSLYTSLCSLTDKTHLKYFLTFTYLCPLIIVSITLAVYKTEGYGTDKYCWLSFDGGLFWPIVGPIVAVICVNCLVLLAVIRKSRRQPETEAQIQPLRTLSVVASIVILTVFFGLTWVFGHLSIAYDDVVFQYLFVILNSLQGLVIFVYFFLLQGLVIFFILCQNQQQARETIHYIMRQRKSRSLESVNKMSISLSNIPAN